MPNIFADTSALVGLLSPGDAFFAPVNDRVSDSGLAFFYPPMIRFELRHNLQRVKVDSNGEAAWRALRASEKGGLLRGVSVDLLATLRAGEQLSEQHPEARAVGSADVLHVATARELGAAEFWTCDEAQAALARAAGLVAVLFTPAS